MSQSRQLTPPFDGDVDLPVHIGWYACAWKHGLNVKRNPWEWPRRHWNGKRFSLTKDKRSAGSFHNHELIWCGLTAPHPKDHP